MLKLDYCTHKAAKYAVENWHYSRCMPVGKLVKIGVWEKQKFIGTVIFGRGANPNMGKKYGLGQKAVCELTRIALTDHDSAVSRIMTIAVKLLKRKAPRLRLIVSYADTEQNHHGGIYQASNWIYSGICEKAGGYSYYINGKWQHKRSLGAKYGRRDSEYLDKLFPNAQKRIDSDKHRYLMPLDEEMKDRIQKLSKPYPKRLKQAMAVQQHSGGVAPT